MAFDYDDGNVQIIVLGGVNKTTGEKNPTELIGYYLRQGSIDTKFGTKPLYVFRTPEGDKGIIGSGNLNKLMETKVPGLLTHIVDTGTTKDIGKGNPMKVYVVGQDRNDVMLGQLNQPAAEEESYEEEAAVDEVAPVRPSRPAVAAATPSASAQARVQALLGKR